MILLYHSALRNSKIPIPQANRIELQSKSILLNTFCSCLISMRNFSILASLFLHQGDQVT